MSGFFPIMDHSHGLSHEQQKELVDLYSDATLEACQAKMEEMIRERRARFETVNA